MCSRVAAAVMIDHRKQAVCGRADQSKQPRTTTGEHGKPRRNKLETELRWGLRNKRKYKLKKT